VAHVVSCAHCGAPQALGSGQTRFRCAWCGGLGTVEEPIGVQELAVAAEPSVEAARRAGERWLLGRGLHGARLWVRSPSWIPYWQVVNHRGEEHVVCARPGVPALESSLRAPATQLVGRSDLACELGRPEIDRSAAVAAARATFEHPEATIEELRLIWVPVMELSAWTAAGSVRGLYVAGSGHVVFEPLPHGARGHPLQPVPVLAYAGYVLLAIAVGLTIESPLWRALAQLAVLVAALAAWRRCWTTPSRGST
jgi:hypothetical protein